MWKYLNRIQIPLLVALFLVSNPAASQVIDIRNDRNLPPGPGGAPTENDEDEMLELFNQSAFGFSSGLIAEANTQVLRLRIGESEGFSIPFRILLSAPSAGLGNEEPQQITMYSLISATGGVLNTLFSDSRRFLNVGSETVLSASYGFGYKLVNGRSMVEDEALNLSTFYGDLGLRFVTGAHVIGDPEKKGTTIFQFKAFATAPVSDSDRLEAIFGQDIDTWFIGLSADMAIFITNEVDLRVSWARSLTHNDLDELNPGMIKFAVDYNLNN